jgi:uncharacterized protein (TIGR02687 family)
MSKVENALQQLFENHRIVFWYDTKKEMREAFDGAWLVGVEKLEIKGNAFGLKYHILREARQQKFLLYHEGPPPDNLDNWLLDVQLAHAVFNADQVSLWMAELGLGIGYADLVRAHEDFFRSAARREALRERGLQDESPPRIRLKMMAVCLGAGVEARLETILMALLDGLARNEMTPYDDLEKYALLPTLWAHLEGRYGYRSDAPHIKDFAIHLFDSCYRMGLHEPLSEDTLSTEALILMNHWQDSLRYRESFETLSDRFARMLNISQDLNQHELQALVSLDLFKVIDFHILEGLMAGIKDRSLNARDVRDVVRQRSAAYWYPAVFEALYQAVETASDLLARFSEIHFQINNLADGVRKYSSTWYQVDQLYREYIYAVRQSKQATFFKSLNELIEGHYVNTFLTPLNNHWQQVMDGLDRWGDPSSKLQRSFYDDWVDPILQGRAKVAVIISDAMRYEVGDALQQRIEREGRFSAEIEPMLGMLPSYTALGMAALLPQTALAVQPDGTVTADGLSTAGRENRAKLLAQELPQESTVLMAEELMAMTHDQRRALFRENQVVYVYHNQIDAVGDKAGSEDRTFDAVAAALTEVSDLIKTLANANFTKILVTADHGFLYQYQPIEESTFADTEISGGPVYARNRRFVVGQGLQQQMSLRHWRPEQVGLSGEYDILIAKSIHRLRLKGAGMRFVHGGASLQEIILPVVSISKERTGEADTRKVQVDKINGTQNKITTGQISVSFYQTEPVSTKVLGRTLRVGIYAQDGRLISNVHQLNFNFESENPRDREERVTFQLTSEADQYNKQLVYLRLEELIANTSKYQTVQEWPYTLDRAPFALF